MKEIELSSTTDDEKNSFIKDESALKNEKEEENKVNNNIMKPKDSAEFLIKDDERNENNLLNEIDSNAPLIINKTPNRFFGLKLYINNDICFQILKMTKIGNTKAFFYNTNDDPLFIIGPQWPYCLALLIGITLIYILIYLYFNKNSSTLVKIIDWILYILWDISYISTCIKNPGYPKMCSETIKGNKDMLYCEKCELWYKPTSSTIHCDICDICIEGFTHHCFWFGHCIGINNKKEFYAFLFLSFIFPIYLMVNIILFGNS
jgi:hypothetical protein